jgi:hypothetical protein
MLAGPKISAGLKNYENLKIESFCWFISSAGQNLAWFLSKDRILTGRANIFPEPTFFPKTGLTYLTFLHWKIANFNLPNFFVLKNC